MMYYCRGLRVEIVRGDIEFKPLEQLEKELPRVPELDLAAKEEHVGDVERTFVTSRKSLDSYVTLFHSCRYQES